MTSITGRPDDVPRADALFEDKPLAQFPLSEDVHLRVSAERAELRTALGSHFALSPEELRLLVISAGPAALDAWRRLGG